jgi:peptidoglycan/LPS O-acetylase OafA/YrhL
MSGMGFTLLNLLLSFALNVIGAVMAFIILQKIAVCVRWENSRALTLLKKVSMPIYLLHQQVIYFFVYYLNGHLNPYIHAVVNFGGAIIVSTILSCILLKFKWTRYLVGEK